MGFNFVALVETFEALLQLFYIAFVVTGASLILFSLLQVKNFYKLKMNTGQGVSLSYAGWSLVAGILLISYTTTDAMLAETLTFNSAVNPFSYSGANQSMTQSQALSKLIDLLYKSFGSVAVFKGLLLLRELGHQRMVQNNPKSPLGQAIGFMVFGQFAIHHEEVFVWVSEYVPLLQVFTSSLSDAFDVPTT